MTLAEIDALGIVAGMLVLFVSERLRYDLVAGLILACAVILGIVPAAHAFGGFSNPAIIIIAAALVLSRAIAVSGVLESAISRTLRPMLATSWQVGMLSAI